MKLFGPANCRLYKGFPYPFACTVSFDRQRLNLGQIFPDYLQCAAADNLAIHLGNLKGLQVFVNIGQRAKKHLIQLAVMGNKRMDRLSVGYFSISYFHNSPHKAYLNKQLRASEKRQIAKEAGLNRQQRNKFKKKLEKTPDITTMLQIMKFILIDKIESLQRGTEITATKSVSLAEEYLADHFPVFPVLPGVLLLEGLIESASWLVRCTENFAHSMVLLAQARNVKYKSFAAPSMQIRYNVKAKSIDENISSFIGTGTCQDKTIVEAKFSLRHFNLADENSQLAAVDAEVIENMKKRLELLSDRSTKD